MNVTHSTYAHSHAQPSNTAKQLIMVKNERMGGYVPQWVKDAPAQSNSIEKSIEQALKGSSTQTAQNILAYRSDANTPNAQSHNAQDFGFGDLIDMINPLHHIPVLGHAYRAITGDEVKPIAKIIGGAAFGGALGAASSVIDMLVAHETGKDMAGNALEMAFGNLGNNEAKDEDTTRTILSFADLSQPSTDNPQGLYKLG